MQPQIVQTKYFSGKLSGSGANGAITDYFDTPVTRGNSIVAFVLREGTEDATGVMVTTADVKQFYRTNVQTLLNNKAKIDTYVLNANLEKTQKNGVLVTYNGVNGQNTLVVMAEIANVSGGSIRSQSSMADTTMTGYGSILSTGGMSNVKGTSFVFTFAATDGGQKPILQSPDFTAVADGNMGQYNLSFGYKVTTPIEVQQASYQLQSDNNWLAGITNYYLSNPIIVNWPNTGMAANNGATVTGSFLTTPVLGNFLTASVYATGGTPLLPGWTLSKNQSFNTTENVSLFYKVSDGTESSVTSTATGATVMEMHLQEYTGVNNPVLLDNTVVGTSGNSSSTFVTQNYTSLNKNILIVNAVGLSGTSQTITGGPFETQLAVTPHLVTSLALTNDGSSSTFQQYIGYTPASAAGVVTAAFQCQQPIVDPLAGGAGSVGAGS